MTICFPDDVQRRELVPFAGHWVILQELVLLVEFAQQYTHFEARHLKAQYKK